MLFSLDLLAERRATSEKFRVMSARKWKALDLPREWAWELAVLISTPGFLFEHHALAFGWGWAVCKREIPRILDFFADDAEVEVAAQANFRSITRQTAEEYLVQILMDRETYGGPAPLWASYSVKELLGLGWDRKRLSERYRVPPGTITRWSNERVFDPLTGLVLPGWPRAGRLGSTVKFFC